MASKIQSQDSSHHPRISRHVVLAAAIIDKAMDWQELVPSSSYFCNPIIDGRQIAKDGPYLESILQAWQDNEKGGERLHTVEMKPITYPTKNDDDDGNNNNNDNTASTCLHGYLLRRRSTAATRGDATIPRPAILFFHTAAGPQDIFLYYKADCLLQKFDCVIMICDILSDANGWGWDPDRGRYNAVRDALLKDNGTVLRDRVSSALQYLARHVPQVDRHRLAAMGWCLGGQPLLELATLPRENHSEYTIKALISFHGVFARESSLRLPPSHDTSDNDNATSMSKTMLICNGRDDPFVTPADLQVAMDFFTDCGYKVELLQISNAKHGFTNPAQVHNTNPAFGFSQEGSVLAWTKSQDLLQQALFE